MYGRYGQQPDSRKYDCRPYLWGNAETCTDANPGAGTLYIEIYGYGASAGVTFNWFFE
ncbi:MAG: PPC domain-containing protein [Psychrosphaera sp.]|nr:PPC domain-containing protein [Psychrosphaera sp.]